MKKLERNIPGVYDFDEVLDYLHRGIMDMRTNVVWSLIQMQDTVTLAGQWDGRRDGVRCAFRVYEKYIYTRFKRLPPYPDHDAGGPGRQAVFVRCPRRVPPVC